MKAIHFLYRSYQKYLPLLTAVLFLLLFLTHPKNSMQLVNHGLYTWYAHMIPSLFPFMVLSTFLLKSGISRQLSTLVYPLLGRIFHLSEDCIYIIVMGFLCGFPMGAAVIAESLTLKKISQREAELLFAFCNNIGPVYFLSFVTIACPYHSTGLTFAILYLIPFFYGLFLRYTKYQDIPKASQSHTGKELYITSPNYLLSLQEGTVKGLSSILTLGAYMVIFNVLQLPLYNRFYTLTPNILCVIQGLLEINSGIEAIQEIPSLYGIVYAVFLPFGGLCCIFQTYAMIKDTSLSLRQYLHHKLVQTFFSAAFYFGILPFL